MIKILLIDNYDSFTYNVSQSMAAFKGEIEVEVEVIRNDQISVQEVKSRLEQKIYDAIVISPGPGTPKDAGITMDLIQQLGPSHETEHSIWPGTPILGICLGHQAIGEVFGGQVILAPEPVHGKPEQIYHKGQGIFAGLPSPFQATRYHSLIVDWKTLPKDENGLEIIAYTEADDNLDHLIMGLKHRKYPWIQGVQFHPESFLTDVKHQKQIFKNFFSAINRENH
jgi:anthranilate synthase component II